MKWLRLGALSIACLLLALIPARSTAAPPRQPDPVDPEVPKHGKRELIAGGVLLSFGLAAELSGAVIATGCSAGWCRAGFAFALGEPEGPNRYTLVSTGPSSMYVVGRLVSAPLLIGGFTLTMVGLASAGERTSKWSDAAKRRVAWSLLGSGIGVLVVSRALRAVFLSTGTCQAPTCVHGLDQMSLWFGRGLTFAGAGIMVRGAAKPFELGLAGGPTEGFGLSVTGRF